MPGDGVKEGEGGRGKEQSELADSARTLQRRKDHSRVSRVCCGSGNALVHELF